LTVSGSKVQAGSSVTASTRVEKRGRSWLILAFLFVLLARLGFFVWSSESAEFITDFDLLYHSAVSLTHGVNPYHAVPEQIRYPLFYPLPAILLAVPFSLLPFVIARPVWDIAIGWLFAYALWKRGRYALLALISGAYIFAMRGGQATPLLVAASLIPSLGFLLTVKPNMGLALWLSRPSRKAVIGSAAVLLVSLAVLPSWPLDWFTALQERNDHLQPPVLRPFGWLLLLAAFRWRTPEGRLLVASALIPQTSLPYELVPLALIPANAVEMGIFALGSWVAFAARVGLFWQLGITSLTPLVAAIWPIQFVCVYLPMLYLVLRRSSTVPVDSVS
jgi:hypothetical protein